MRDKIASLLERVKAWGLGPLARGPSRSYLVTGFWVATVTALLFIQFDMLVFPLLGLTCGLVSRHVGRCVSGLILSTSCGIFFWLASVGFHRITPLSPDFGFFPSGNTSTYAHALYGACFGAVLLLPQGRFVFMALVGCLLGIINLLIVSAYLVTEFPGRTTFLRIELWEYATVVAAVPIMSFWLWGPVTLLRYKQMELYGRIFPLLVSLKKSMDKALFQSKSHPLMLERAVRVAVTEKEEYGLLVEALGKSRFVLPGELTDPIRRFLDIVLDALVEPLNTETEEDAAMKHGLVDLHLNTHYMQALQAFPRELDRDGN